MIFARERFDHADAGKGLLHGHDHLSHVFLFVPLTALRAACHKG